MSSIQFREAVEATFTQWRNPLGFELYVDLKEQASGPPTRHRWKPGETKSLPSLYDNAIQRVHNGQIVGGKAPLLEKVGADLKLDPALDMFAAEKQQREAQQVSAAYAKKAADEALLLAAAKVEEAKVDAKKSKP